MTDTVIAVSAILMIVATVVGCGFFLFTISREKFVANQTIMTGIVCVYVISMGYMSLAISKHYSVDSFNLIFDMGPYWHLQLGRYLNSGIILLAIKLGVHQVLQQQFFCIIWILSLSIATFIIATTMCRCLRVEKMQLKIIVILSTLIAFVNVFVMEFVLFPEMMMVSAIGVIAIALSIFFALSDMKAPKRWGLSSLFLLIALGNYQSYIGIFVSFILAGGFFKWSDKKNKRYQEALRTLVCGGGASVFNIVLVKLLISANVIVDSGRGVGLDYITIKRNIIQIIQYQKYFWYDADGLLPHGVMLVVLAFLLFFIASQLWFLKKQEWIYFLFLLTSCYMLGFAAHIIESKILLTPRSNIAIWSAIAVIFIFTAVVRPPEKIKIIQTAALWCVGVLLTINIFYMWDMASNTQAVNAADFTEANQICAKIKEYEAKTGEKINKISVRNDMDVTVYPEISRYRNSELGARILSISYSNYRLLGYELGRSLERVEMPEIVYQEFFEGKDWKCLDLEEQMVFDGDTVHLMIY